MPTTTIILTQSSKRLHRLSVKHQGTPGSTSMTLSLVYFQYGPSDFIVQDAEIPVGGDAETEHGYQAGRL